MGLLVTLLQLQYRILLGHKCDTRFTLDTRLDAELDLDLRTMLPIRGYM